METQDVGREAEEAVVITGDDAACNDDEPRPPQGEEGIAVEEQEGDKSEQADAAEQEQEEVIEFVMEPAEDSSTAVAPAAGEPEALTLLSMEDGTYIVESVPSGGGDTTSKEVRYILDKKDEGAAAATVIIQGDGMAVLEEQEAEGLTITNNAPNQKMELLRKIWFDASSAAFMDFPVFCKDGVAFSNRLVLAAASPWMRSVSA